MRPAGLAHTCVSQNKLATVHRADHPIRLTCKFAQVDEGYHLDYAGRRLPANGRFVRNLDGPPISTLSYLFLLDSA